MTSSKDAILVAPGLTTRNKKLLGTRASLLGTRKRWFLIRRFSTAEKGSHVACHSSCKHTSIWTTMPKLLPFHLSNPPSLAVA